MSPRSLIVILVIAVGLTVLFWTPLWQGYGLMGGDLYTYFFPQKLFYADQLVKGRIPLWNDLVAFGYPQLAESQTGVLYPPNLLLYRFLEVNTAYNVSQLGHYVLAFVFTWLLLRKLNLSVTGALFGAIIFVYGWFPPRICLEWAIIGGVYFPLSLWCVESFLQSRRRRWLVLLAVGQALHLLAGHFTLAFITQLTCVAYAGLRGLAFRNLKQSSNTPNAERPFPNAATTAACVVAAIGVGFALSAVQLLPTWELKQASQREEIGAHHDPGYGHIPPWYLSQIIAPWYWYPSDVNPDNTLWTVNRWTIPSSTNKVEAHLYFGMVPLLLILYRLIAVWRGNPLERRVVLWSCLGLAAMVYTTGWLLPITRHLPGFEFFMGPGRYGMVTTLAAGLLAGAGLDQLLGRATRRSLLIGLIVGLTLADLYWVSRRVTYAVMVEYPPLEQIDESVVRQFLKAYESARPHRPVRMVAQGPNLATLTGFAAYPQYLGIGPAAYFDPDLKLPELTDEMTKQQRKQTIEARHQWLREGAFTHILATEQIKKSEWPPATLLWRGYDPLLNRLYAHPELLLYELTDTNPRIHLEGSGTVQVETIRPKAARALVTTSTGGKLVWADLAYPGWKAHISNDQRTESIDTSEEFLRSVTLPPGKSSILWTYEPGSFRIGAMISLASLAAVCLVCAYWIVGRRSNRHEPGPSKPTTFL